jgi:formylmethanofuran dehydrogenase subunit B
MHSARLSRLKPGNKKVKDSKNYAKLYLGLAICFVRVTGVNEVVNNLKGYQVH